MSKMDPTRTERKRLGYRGFAPLVAANALTKWEAQFQCEPPPPLPPGTYCWYCAHDGAAYTYRMVPNRMGESLRCCPDRECGCTAHMERSFTIGETS